ncbi:MAG TPA: phosphopantetheine-binding protein [Chitinophagales bacterium]|nr:phosphopantetheine-binding protein [Chitinophagales bacterium]HRK28169.1 phosphopantetheine-binding protein [Chitinophagales bacterium]
MSIELFISQFAEQFDETDPTEFTPHTEFKRLNEWSSMHALLIIALIDAEYNIPFTGEDLQTCTTIADIYQIISRRMGSG